MSASGRRPRASRPPRRGARARRARPRARRVDRRATSQRDDLRVRASARRPRPRPTAPRAASRPAATPMNSIAMSRSGSLPESRIMFCARSTICTGSPMSSTKTSPRPPIAPAWTTSCDRLGDRHEEARHLGVRDGDRARRARSGGGRSGSRCRTSRARCRSGRRRSCVVDVVARGRTPRRSTRRAPSSGP